MSKVEDIAVAWVMELERAAGREPRDTRQDRSAPADLDSPPRLIEVKAFGGSARGDFLWLEVSQFRAAREWPARFHLYVVDNVRLGEPAMQVRDLHGDRLTRLLDRATEYRAYTTTWPVADYDAGPTGLT